MVSATCGIPYIGHYRHAAVSKLNFGQSHLSSPLDGSSAAQLRYFNVDGVIFLCLIGLMIINFNTVISNVVELRQINSVL